MSRDSDVEELGYSTAVEEDVKCEGPKQNLKKRSERLRIKSERGKKNYSKHGEEFVYDFGEFAWDPEGESLQSEEETAGTSSTLPSAWSKTAGAAAVVERRVNISTPPKGQRKSNRSAKKSKFKSGLDYKHAQQKLRQKRIDILFTKQTQQIPHPSSQEESEEETEVYLSQKTVVKTGNAECYAINSAGCGTVISTPLLGDCNLKLPPAVRDAVKLPRTSPGNTSESSVKCCDNTSVNAGKHESNTLQVNSCDPVLTLTSQEPLQREQRYLTGYGSDYDSFTTPGRDCLPSNSCAHSGNTHTTDSDFDMAGKGETSLLGDMDENEPLSVKHWSVLLQEMKNTVKVEVDRLFAENNKKLEDNITEVTNAQVNIKSDIQGIQSELKICQEELREVRGTTVKQSQELQECKAQIELLSQKCDQNVIKISGIEVKDEENCVNTCNSFFKNKLKIERAIPIIDAFRVGDPKASHRTIVIYLQNPRDKGLIFANTKNLKNVVNTVDQPYNVFDQQSARKRSRRNRQRQIMAVNRGLDAELQRTMKMEKGELMIDGEKYVSHLKAPSCKDILLASKEQRSERLGKEVKKGVPKLFRGQEFLGYTTVVKSIHEANIAYAKIRAIHPEARHVVSAVRIPGRSYFHNQDFNDDDEHGGGSYLLDLLLESQIQNRAVYVVRNYDGEHIGSKRFELMREAIQSALSRSPANEVTGNHDCLWEQQPLGAGIRGGRNRGRGGRGGSGPYNRRVKSNNRDGSQQGFQDNFLHGLNDQPTDLNKTSYAEMAKLKVTIPNQGVGLLANGDPL